MSDDLRFPEVPPMVRCQSTRLDGTQCDRPALHSGAHIHETTNGLYGWENDDDR